MINTTLRHIHSAYTHSPNIMHIQCTLTIATTSAQPDPHLDLCLRSRSVKGAPSACVLHAPASAAQSSAHPTASAVVHKPPSYLSNPPTLLLFNLKPTFPKQEVRTCQLEKCKALLKSRLGVSQGIPLPTARSPLSLQPAPHSPYSPLPTLPTARSPLSLQPARRPSTPPASPLHRRCCPDDTFLVGREGGTREGRIHRCWVSRVPRS
jgi:hypothetical protein